MNKRLDIMSKRLDTLSERLDSNRELIAKLTMALEIITDLVRKNENKIIHLESQNQDLAERLVKQGKALKEFETRFDLYVSKNIRLEHREVKN